MPSVHSVSSLLLSCILLTPCLGAQQDVSSHRVRFIAVESDVQLEVLDWGGSGRAVVLLAGLGNDAHIFDAFAPKLAATYHVYGVTRRGFGASSIPRTGYGADRLGDDVLAVLDSLGLVRPVLAGHSIAGEELSSIGSRHPERVAGLVYLDAGNPYAFYDREHPNKDIDVIVLARALGQFMASQGSRPLLRELLDVDLPSAERSLSAYEKALPPVAAAPPRLPAPSPPRASPAPASSAPAFSASLAVTTGEQRYTEIRGRVLAIYAFPHQLPAAMANDSAGRAAFAASEAVKAIQIDAFEKGVPGSRVVRLPNADHYVFRSNEADVMREMRSFIDGLPREQR